MNRNFYGRKSTIPLSNKILLVASLVCLVAAVVVFIFFNNYQKKKNNNEATLNASPTLTVQTPEPTSEIVLDPIIPSEMKIGTRFNPPAGYTRTTVSSGTFGDYLRNFTLREYATKPLVYDSETKTLINYEAAPAVSVLALDLINKGNLQQSSDSVIRLYGEYLYSQGRYNDISFKLLTTPIFTCDFKTWSEGGRLLIDGNQISWCTEHGENCSHKDVELGTSAGTFRYYLQNVMTYSDTSSLITNMNKVSAQDMQIGDVIVYADASESPSVIVDMAESSDGSKLYIMARGGSPASEIYIVRNTSNFDINPWHNPADLPVGATVYRFK